MSTFDLAQHQRDRIRDLDSTSTMLDAEVRRLRRLLALALDFACHGKTWKPTYVLELLAAIDDTNLERPAHVEEAKRAEAEELRAELGRQIAELTPEQLWQVRWPVADEAARDAA